MVAIIISHSVAILSLFIIKPSLFNTLSLEDGKIEWASAILLFASCLISSGSFFISRNVSSIAIGTQFSIAFLSL